MNSIEQIAKRDLLLCSIVTKYSEWLEMSEEPNTVLIEILTSLLMKSEEENEYLKKIAASRSMAYKTVCNG